MRTCPKCNVSCLESHRYCPSCGANTSKASSSPSHESLIGASIGGKFVMQELIGTGGMGKVYRADQRGVGRTVAVKVMHSHLMGDETAAARFAIEARAASRLNHPHSISLLDFGRTEAGVLYIVMEFLRGQPLDAILDQPQLLPLSRIADIMCQAMEAVDAAHKLNIIHRDLKPENIFLLDRKGKLDFVKVLDFGIAKILDLKDRSVTTPGLVPGTPEYMSPEQARGEQLDPRSDVYSLGVIFYELLTGTVPFQGRTPVAIMMAHVQDPPVPPSQRAPDRNIPAALDAIVLWALAKNPVDRISSAGQFREVISAWAKVAGVWPVADSSSASPADALLELFSEDQLIQFRDQATREIPVESLPTIDSTRALPTPSPANRLVGRERELRQLGAFLNERGPRTLRILGEPGMGKKRLVDEIIHRAESIGGFDIFRCPVEAGWTPEPLGQAQRAASFCLGVNPKQIDAESLLRAANQFGILPDEIQGLMELFGVPGHLVEVDHTARRRERAAAFRSLVYRRAARKPLLLVFEALHRYDEPSRELITALAAAPREDLALVLTHEPDPTQLWPKQVQALSLEPLQREASVELLHSLFQREIDCALQKRCLDAAAGCPLFMEQLAYALRYDYLIEPQDKIADLIAGRLDARGQLERRLLQTMAAVRDSISLAALCALFDTRVQVSQLRALVEAGFLREHKGRFSFVHELLAVVIHSSTPAEVRREIHQMVAANLRARQAPSAAVAYHAYHADDGPQAIEDLDCAAVWATRHIDLNGAIHHYNHALELVRREWGRGRLSATELDRMAVDLTRRLAAVLHQTGDMVAAEGVLEEILSVVAVDDATRASLRLDLGRIASKRGNLARALRHLQLARTDAQAAASDWLLGEVIRDLAHVTGLMGHKTQALDLLRESLLSSRRAAGQHGEASWNVLLHAARICKQIGYPDRARGYLFDALQQAKSELSVHGKLTVTMLIASIHLSSREWSEAEIRLSQAIELAAQVGDRTSQADLLIDLGRVHRIGGNVESARERLEEAAVICRTIDWWEGIKRAEQETMMLRYADP